ncbi:MAG: hypothetical protein EZS28_052521, partial [Streblomastix strix]
DYSQLYGDSDSDVGYEDNIPDVVYWQPSIVCSGEQNFEFEGVIIIEFQAESKSKICDFGEVKQGEVYYYGDLSADLSTENGFGDQLCNSLRVLLLYLAKTGTGDKSL